jgi:hypothetical protein
MTTLHRFLVAADDADATDDRFAELMSAFGGKADIVNA